MAGDRRAQKRLAKQQANEKVKHLDTAGSYRPPSKQIPSALAAPISIDREMFQWSASALDLPYAGKWSWDLTKDEWAQLLTVLSDLSRKSWAEVKALTFGSKSGGHKRHHSQSVSSLCKEARDQWVALDLEDRPEAFRLRHGNLLRIWGYLHGPEFVILWYDRHHKVYPTEPD